MSPTSPAAAGVPSSRRTMASQPSGGRPTLPGRRSHSTPSIRVTPAASEPPNASITRLGPIRSNQDHLTLGGQGADACAIISMLDNAAGDTSADCAIRRIIVGTNIAHVTRWSRINRTARSASNRSMTTSE